MMERANGQTDEREKTAQSYLPARLREAVSRTAAQYSPVREIRIRRGGELTLTVSERSVSCGVSCTPEEVEETVANLCQQSLYSHAEEIREGVITTESGIRAGVCGQAVLRDGKIDCVRNLSSVCIRIPHRVPGAADGLIELVRSGVSVLVYGKPGAGKTTVLRELIPGLAAGSEGARVSVVDTRYELAADQAGLADLFLGYPRKEGMSAAVRTMSPRFLICDEIADSGDAEAVLAAHASGVTVAASAHAGNADDLRRNPNLRLLLESGVFGVLCGVSPDGLEVRRIHD